MVAWLDARDKDMAKEKGEAFSGVSIYTVRSFDNGASFGPNRRFQKHTCECCRTALTWTPEGPVVFWRNIFGTNTRDIAIANLDKGSVRRATDDEWQIDACPHNGGSIAVGYQDQLTWPGLPMGLPAAACSTNISMAIGNRRLCPSATLRLRQAMRL